MFTVCPKCALTLVVTAADLRVAQGYVRCGRCSNVFNAIVGLSEGGGAAAAGGPGVAAGSAQSGAPQTSTATTSIIRKAPSISDDETPDLINDTGENEAVYAEPDVETQEYSVQDVFAETSTPVAAKAAPAPMATPKPPPPPKPVVAKAPPDEPTFADTNPDVALEFNPEVTDVTQVFIESAPAKKIDLRPTGTFEQIKPQQEPPPPAPPARPTPPRQLSAPPPPRDEEDIALEDELRSLAARLDATGRQPQLKPEAVSAPPAPKVERPPAARFDSTNAEMRSAYSGSPYNSADEPANVARKAAAGASRPATQKPAARAQLATADDEDFDGGAVDDVIAAEAAAGLAPRSMPRGRKLAWIGGSVALVLALTVQAIHHNRHDLATNARLNRPLTRLYAAIGVPLVPRWNLASYDVRQLGAFSGAGENGNLTVRASLKNASDQPLPLPFLRITVQDRYGNRIATRDVAPKGYVPGALPADALLGVGQRIDAEMSFKDPGRDAVGFEIDACLPTPEARIACANDVAASAPR